MAARDQEEGVLGLVGSYSLTAPTLEEWLDAYQSKRWFVGIAASRRVRPISGTSCGLLHPADGQS